jgi:uncharacterized membrane protein YeaQ/YmgE (transglycosylase-associated protein family)
MKQTPFLTLIGLTAFILGAALCIPVLSSVAQNQTSSPAFSEKVGATATEVTQQIQDTGQTALNKVEILWKRIDEKRLKNRTFDELVAWALMGLLVGGLLYRTTNLNQVTTLLVGLTGAFIGGILANVLQLDLGMGPVLIRYEDLVCSIAGGVALFFVWKWLKSPKAKAAATAPK